MNGLSTHELIKNEAVNRRLSKDGLYFHLKIIKSNSEEVQGAGINSQKEESLWRMFVHSHLNGFSASYTIYR